ncbi:MAG: KpsF/GutQ family sugar-phosphate isomerase [bacterium]|nr:KpsF/GutQ family sugar-phosphate isomerase [bacterium]
MSSATISNRAIQEIARDVLLLEADAVRRLADRIDERFERAVEMMLSCRGRVVVTGMGKSGIIGRKISATFASVGTPSVFMHPADAIHGDLGMITEDDVVLALSNSGETEEIVRLLPTIRKIGARMIALCGRLNSTLAQHSDIVLDTAVEREACPYNLAPTASTTAQLAMGDALAMALLHRRNFKPEDYALLHPGGSLGKRLLKVSDVMRTGERLVRVTPDTPVRDVIVAMTHTRNGAACIVNETGTLVGFFTDGDFRRTILKNPDAINRPVGEVMTVNPMTISANQLAVDAARFMRTSPRKISQLPVLDDAGNLVGLLDDDELINL